MFIDSYPLCDIGFTTLIFGPSPKLFLSFFLTLNLQVNLQLSREQKVASGKADMELCEIKNGRLAMIAIVGSAGQVMT